MNRPFQRTAESAVRGIVTGSIADQTRSLNPKIVTRSIPGAGHNVRRENFDAFINAVLEFLQSD